MFSMLNKKCRWVLEETDGQKCQEIKNACEEIDRSITCEDPGAAETEIEVLSCIWLDENSAGTSEAIAGRCALKVYLFYLDTFFF
jgi:hypothetical protein